MPCFAQPCYYTTTVSVCQGVFQKFFQLFSCLFPSRSGSARTVYHILSRLSRGFSKVFSTFFAVPFRSVSSRCPLGHPLLDSLHIIALSFPFVNRFLQSFFTLVKVAGLHKFGHGFCAPCPINSQFVSHTGECAGSVMLIFHAFSPSKRQSAFCAMTPTRPVGGRSTTKVWTN